MYQVRLKETKETELLMRCRKETDDVKTGQLANSRDKSGGSLLIVQMASGIKVA
jgi:hypothetical protein